MMTGGSHRRWLWTAVAVAVIAGAILGISNSHAVGHQIAISVSRQATPFTQLYLTRPNDVPRQLVAPGPNSFSFTIDNGEGHSTDYAYTVTLATPLTTSVVSRGTLRVADGKTITKAIDIFSTVQTNDYEVTVQLGQRAEVIHFRGGSE
jgi:hypothetical protein